METMNQRIGKIRQLSSMLTKKTHFNKPSHTFHQYTFPVAINIKLFLPRKIVYVCPSECYINISFPNVAFNS
jgi:hypothetical protein